MGAEEFGGALGLAERRGRVVGGRGEQAGFGDGRFAVRLIDDAGTGE